MVVEALVYMAKVPTVHRMVEVVQVVITLLVVLVVLLAVVAVVPRVYIGGTVGMAVVAPFESFGGIIECTRTRTRRMCKYKNLAS